MTGLRASVWHEADLSVLGVATEALSGLSLLELGQAMHAARCGHGFLDWQQFQYALTIYDSIEAGQGQLAAVRRNLLDVYAQAALEVQVGLSSTDHAAHALLDDAFAARDRLPQVAQLLRVGRIDRRRFHRIVAETDLVDDPARMAELDGLIAAQLTALGSATALSEAKTAGLARRLVAQVDPEAVRERREDAKNRRAVSTRVLADGLGQLTVIVTAEDMRLMTAAVDTVVAGRCAGDGRTKDQARADAMRALVSRTQFVCQCESVGCTAQIRPGQIDERMTRILIHVLADSSTLEGANTCGYVDGYGPVSADHVREIAARPDAAIRRHDLNDLLEDLADALDDRARWRDWEPPLEWFDDLGPPPSWSAGFGLDLSALTAADPALGVLIEPGPAPEWLDDWDAALAALIAEAGAESTGADRVRVITRTALASDGYRPTAVTEVLARFLWATCSVPGCERAAFSCDLDHVAEYNQVCPQQGGPTCLCNLLPKCRYHHLMKTHLDGFVDELWIDGQGCYHSAMTTPGGLTVEVQAPNQWLLPQLAGVRCRHQLADTDTTDSHAASSGSGSGPDVPGRVRTRTQAKHARRRAQRKANQTRRTDCDLRAAAAEAAAQARYLDSLGAPPF